MGAYLNIPRDNYTPRGEPLTPELMALLDQREADNREELAAAQRQAETDRERQTANLLSKLPTDVLEAELSRRVERERLATAYRAPSLDADDLALLEQAPLEYRTQITRMTYSGASEDAINAVRRQAIAFVRRGNELVRKEALQAKAAEIIASEMTD
jgi:hypothetical protein